MDKIHFHNISDITDINNNISRLIIKDEFDIEISYLSNFSSTKYLRDIISNICFGLNIKNSDIYKITLIIDELNNNAIEYGSNDGEINKLRFKAKRINNIIELNIEVEDSGNGIKSKKASDMEELRMAKLKIGYLKHNSIRGRGLFLIILKLVDNLYFEDSSSGGLIVGVNKTIKI